MKALAFIFCAPLIVLAAGAVFFTALAVSSTIRVLACAVPRESE